MTIWCIKLENFYQKKGEFRKNKKEKLIEVPAHLIIKEKANVNCVQSSKELNRWTESN